MVSLLSVIRVIRPAKGRVTKPVRQDPTAPSSVPLPHLSRCKNRHAVINSAKPFTGCGLIPAD